MLHRLIISFVMVMSLFASAGAQAHKDKTPKKDDGGEVVVQDRPVPWPWGLEQPFPWADIQGVWTVADADFKAYSFVFKVVTQKNTGVKHLSVKQVNTETCEVIATGVGYELDDKTVRAQMTSTAGTIYNLAIHAFAEEDSPRPVVGRVVTSQVMVLSLTSLNSSSESQPLDLQIGKMSVSLDASGCAGDKDR